MEPPSRQIRPLPLQSLEIKSLYTYQDVLRKRPKRPLRFKFLIQDNMPEDQKKNAKNKLLKTLCHLKPLQKLDLSDFKVNSSHINSTICKTIFKNISKIPTVLLTRHQSYHQLRAEKWIKCISRLRKLTYVSTSWILKDAIPDKKDAQITDPLRYLRYCPHVRFLQIGAFGSDYTFSNTFKSLREYPKSLKHLVIDSLLDDRDAHSIIPFEHFSELESIHLVFIMQNYPKFVVQNLEQLSKLTKLKEIGLQVYDLLISPELPMALKKLAKFNTLKKFSLIGFETFLDQETFEALQNFDQLTHLTLRIDIEKEESLQRVWQCFSQMKKN